MNLAKLIKDARLEAGLSQAQLGIQCGWGDGSPQSRIGNYEQGKRIPSALDIAALAKALNKSVLYFYEQEEVATSTSSPTSLNDILAGNNDDIELLKRCLVLIDDVLDSDPSYKYTAEQKAKAILGVLFTALSSPQKELDRSTAIAALRTSLV